MFHNTLNNLEILGVTVVIVTYNGSQRIIPTLQHLAAQKNVDFDWEVLIIDNNCTDNTSNIAQEFWNNASATCALRIVQEPKPGTMYARQKGMQEASYRYLLYCDDDNWLNENYLKTAFDIIDSDPEIAAVGGMGIMEYEQGFVPPEWITAYERNYGTGFQGKEDGDTTNDKRCLYTAGAIIDRKWIKHLYSQGFVSSLKGRDGKSLVAGEDTELTFALGLIGGRLYYSSKMHFRHYMPSNRISWEYLKKLWHSFGYSDYIISPYLDYFWSRKQSSQWKQLLQRIRDWRYLYFKQWEKGFKEGDKEILLIERIKGEIKAIIFANERYKSNQVMVQHLLRKDAKK